MIWLLTLSLLPLGRLSGGWLGHSGLYSPIIGLIFGLLFGVTDWWLVGFALAGWWSESFSPARDSLGDITDGEGDKYDYINLAERGVLGTMPYLLLSFLAPVYWVFAFVIAWPLSTYFGTKLPKYTAWQWSEILRYFLVGIPVMLWS